MDTKSGCRVPLAISVMTVAALALGFHARYAFAQDQPQNPYSPAYGHPYRHGVVPTLEAWQEMQAWEAEYRSQAVTPATTTASKIVAYGGGIDGIGVTSGTPRLYLVFYGSQWASSGDPNGAAIYLETLYSDIGTGSELWSGTTTQYCDGSSVSKGATSCPNGAQYVGYPFMGALAGVWFDTSSAAPYEATQAQLADEAVAAAAHFGNTSAASNRYVQYVIASPSGTHPDGFNLGAGFCAWHDYTTSSYGDIAYTNTPYVSDEGKNCGENYVNSGSQGTLDGFSIVGGHEYAETLTDQNPFGGWTNQSTASEFYGAEVGDECAWSLGISANVRLGNGTYAMQSIWSNDTDACDLSHSLIGTSLSAASSQQCGTFTTSTSNYSGNESYSCTVQVTVSGSGGYVATATAYPFASGGNTTVSSNSTVFPGMVTVSGNTVSATYSSNAGWCFPPPNDATYAAFGNCSFPQTIVLSVTDSVGSTQTFAFSIGLSSDASFCPPPGVGDECSESDPLYATN